MGFKSRKTNGKKAYNVRVYDHGDGTWSLGFVSSFKETPNHKTEEGQWVTSSPTTVIRLLQNGTMRQTP